MPRLTLIPNPEPPPLDWLHPKQVSNAGAPNVTLGGDIALETLSPQRYALLHLNAEPPDPVVLEALLRRSHPYLIQVSANRRGACCLYC